ncbi:protein kinase [Micromonospora sp. WMMD1102]|uniref:protein kinase domain-containing protein n=1 Tax=Micromonospora sp. WMMD1102 TaxID=3016105 RepID=UPI002415662C|nr:protein kinase [Micromonospora sp. WMMD1102]MDG4789234.1 protein kinase [Micromonospora sp. WMMD1102]
MRGIADYRFVRPLGSGNHGHFYLAERPSRLPVAAETVAVKVLFAESVDAAFRRATRELAAFAAVRSPYVVAPYDAGQHDGLFYYAMEYLPDGSLAAPADPPTPAAGLRALADAARAAANLHAAGIVHRDIKPGNVLLRPGGGKLSDLGLAQVFTEGVTVTGMGPVDSVEFVDPAVLLGEASSPAADVWSLGVTLHRLVAGDALYPGLRAGDGLLALRTVLSTPPRPSPALPPEVRDLVTDCLAPPDRRPDAATVAARLDRLAEAAG